MDDDKIQHMINRKNLLRINPELELFFFENPKEALTWISENAVDLLLLDVNMPEMKGWDFLDQLVELNIQVEVKMLTASNDPEDEVMASKYPQVTDILVKPLVPAVISEFLGIVLD